MAEDTHGMGIPLPADSTPIHQYPAIARMMGEKIAEILAGGLTADMRETITALLVKSVGPALAAEIEAAGLLGGTRIDSVPGLSVTFTDSHGNRTRLEANDTDGGPTDHTLSLDGPALRDYMDFLTGTDPRIPSVDHVPGVSLAMVDDDNRPLWIQANDTDGGPTPYTVKMLRAALGVAGGAGSTYIADGDSITQGGHGGGTPHNWPEYLGTLLGAPVTNRGRSGTTGVEIAMRQGGLTPILTVTGGMIPAGTAAVAVQRIYPTDAAGGYTGGPGHGARTYAGTFDGIPAELTENTDNTWTIRRTVAGTAHKTTPRTPFLIDGLDPKATRIIWPGRNDYPKTNVLANIDHMAKWTTDNGGRFLVVSILTQSGAGETDADSVEVRAVNEAVQAKYPRDFVNMRDYLVRYGIAAAGLTPTQADLDATAIGGIPPSLMADALHPNAAGRIAIAKHLYEQLKARDLA